MSRQFSPEQSTRQPPDTRSRRAPASNKVIGICASTGGPRALEDLLERLPGDFGVPILVVQHMTPGFLESLVSRLDDKLALPVGLAHDHDRLACGVWFAPDDAHMTLEITRCLSLDGDTAIAVHRPSGDVLLHSLARVAGANAVAVVLTGMGGDGADGLAAVAAAGGQTFAQDEQSSSIFGMPRIAAERGAKTVLPPGAIGDRLAAIDRSRASG